MAVIAEGSRRVGLRERLQSHRARRLEEKEIGLIDKWQTLLTKKMGEAEDDGNALRFINVRSGASNGYYFTITSYEEAGILIMDRGKISEPRKAVVFTADGQYYLETPGSDPNDQYSWIEVNDPQRLKKFLSRTYATFNRATVFDYAFSRQWLGKFPDREEILAAIGYVSE